MHHSTSVGLLAVRNLPEDSESEFIVVHVTYGSPQMIYDWLSAQNLNQTEAVVTKQSQFGVPIRLIRSSNSFSPDMT